VRVAHCVQVGPNRCGLYGTTRDLLKAEIKYGIDAGLLDVTPVTSGAIINGVMEGYPKAKDPLVRPKSYEWAKKADIYIRHSYIPAELQAMGRPLVLALHGRPESSFRLETETKQAIMSTIFKRAQDPRYKGFLCFWKEFMLPWQLVVPKEKLFYVPAPVDLDYYNPKGDVFQIPKEKQGAPNLMIADIWREDIIPLNMLYAATLFQQKYCKTAKIHLLAMSPKTIKCLVGTIAGMKNTGVLGGVSGLTKKVNEFYRAVDIVLTPHTIATRTVREPLACGVPVVAGTGCRFTDYTANPMDIEGFTEAIWRCWRDIKTDREAGRKKVRETAEKNFEPKTSGRAMLRICNEIVGRPKTRRKVFIDIGGHIGESVRRFYREVEDAVEYDIYSFEPEPETFAVLQDTVSHIKNVTLINAAVGFNGIVNFYRGGFNQNEGGTANLNKLRGKVDYKNPIKVKSILFSQWLRENVSPSDYIVVKINAEGGEYIIMKDILSGGVDYIDKIFIQLHSDKFPSPQRQEYKKIEEKFKRNIKAKLFYYGKKDVPLHAA